MDPNKIKEQLVVLLTDVAEQARQDSLAGTSDIGAIFRRDGEVLTSLDVKKIEEAIIDIEKAARTKEGARRLINGLMLVAKSAARIVTR